MDDMDSPAVTKSSSSKRRLSSRVLQHRVQPTVTMEVDKESSSEAAYLNLKPLRELDKNFDIDLASW